MKYRFQIRGIKKNEISTECPYPLDVEEHDIYRDAFIEEIKNIPIVIDVTNEDDAIFVDIEFSSDFNELKEGVKMIFQSSLGRGFRLASELSPVQKY